MRRLVLFTALTAAACGGDSNPTSNTPIAQYAGSWNGTYTITGCTQSGGVASANICGALGNSAPYTFDFTQSSRSVTGSFALGSVQFPGTGGTVNSDGSLQLQAATNSDTVTISVTWNLTNPGNAIGGTVSQVWTATTLSGQANIAGTITSAVHPASVNGVSPVISPQSLHDFVRALKTP
jgi:hypothetical protein